MNTDILKVIQQIEEAETMILRQLADKTLSRRDRKILEDLFAELREQENMLINFDLQEPKDTARASGTLQNLVSAMDSGSAKLSLISNTIKKISGVLSALGEINIAAKAAPPPMSMEMPVPPSSPAVSTPAKAAQASGGKILYDIPDSMVLNIQQKCVVRIGKSEAIVKDNDTFSGAVKIEEIPIAAVMNVELIDIAVPPHFSIKTIVAAEQEVDNDSYTEWLFWVTPLIAGNFSLLLKVSVIKIIDGKERRKELVFEKPVNIISGSVGTAQPVTGIPSRDLRDEKNMVEMEPPHVFISYAHKDKDYFDIFIENLAAQSGWDIWTDKIIEIGSDWYERIQQGIKDADMAVLLVSAFFISSGFIKANEYQKLSDLKQSKPGFIFLPVLLRDVDIKRWEDLSKMQFFSADGDDYGFPGLKGRLLPFANLCIFNDKGELNENYRRDTYFKNLVTKANTDWLKIKRMQAV